MSLDYARKSGESRVVSDESIFLEYGYYPLNLAFVCSPCSDSKTEILRMTDFHHSSYKYSIDWLSDNHEYNIDMWYIGKGTFHKICLEINN